MNTLFGEYTPPPKPTYTRNPSGRFERKSVRDIYAKEIASLRNTIKVLLANKQSVSRQLRARDEEIINLKSKLNETVSARRINPE